MQTKNVPVKVREGYAVWIWLIYKLVYRPAAPGL